MASPDRPAPRHPVAAGPPVVLVRDPGEFVVALPYLLGFHPRESLVLVATGGDSGRRLGLTVRVDLPPPEHQAAVADSVVGKLLLDTPTGAALVVVGSGGAGPTACELVDQVVHGLEHRGVDVHTVLWAESTTAGARWGCYDPCGCGGPLPDPATTVAVANAVALGSVARADRADLERHVTPAADGRLRRRDAMLIQAHDRAVAGDDVVHADITAGVVVVDAALGDAAAGRLVLDDERVVALAVALVAPAVRDVAMLRSAGPLAAAAEHLWAALAREMPDPEAAEPAALLAVSALLRGDGALANVALDRAERAWPGHRLTGLLRQVTDAGIRPGELRRCLGHGHGAADAVPSARSGADGW
ncbi:MAG: hypothetical protein QOG20_1296 [Pseudonocardiales bacterium]|nr:hypothetical protein [Pseudonocardiales bacterium]